MTLKTRMVLMWVFTGLLAALMLLSAVPDMLELPAAAGALIGLVLSSGAYGSFRLARERRTAGLRW